MHMRRCAAASRTFPEQSRPRSPAASSPTASSPAASSPTASSPAASSPAASRRSPLAVLLEDGREGVRHPVCHKRMDLQSDDTVLSFELSVGASAVSESPI
jgi:hypothetical protein